MGRLLELLRLGGVASRQKAARRPGTINQRKKLQVIIAGWRNADCSTAAGWGNNWSLEKRALQEMRGSESLRLSMAAAVPDMTMERECSQLSALDTTGAACLRPAAYQVCAAFHVCLSTARCVWRTL